MFNYVPNKHKQMSFRELGMSNGGKFKLYTVLNGLIFPKPIQPRLSHNLNFYIMINDIFHPRSKLYNVASSIFGVNCGVGGSLIKKKKKHYIEIQHFLSFYAPAISVELLPLFVEGTL
jgi:hypothetical protein